MPNLQIEINGVTNLSRSKNASNQITRNFYLDVNNENVSLIPFPGLKSFCATSTGVARGMGVFNNKLYSITDNTLYEISSSGVATSVGTVYTYGRCELEESTSALVITTGSSKPYLYNGTTLTIGTDDDLPDAATVTYLKNRVVYDGNSGDVVFADLGSPLSVSSVNITSADTKPDDTLAVHAFRDQLFVFSERSITPYYNTGTGSPPFSVIQNAVQEIGLAAIHSVASNYRSLYFLGSDLMPYRISSFQPEPIGNSSIGQAIQGYTNVSDAYGVCFSFDNQYFYMLTFPGQATWLFTENVGWTNLAYGFEEQPHLIYDYAYCYNKHLVQNRLNGQILELDFDTYTDIGNYVDRLRTTKKITGKELGYPGKEIFMERLELVVETGVGLATGEGSEPRIMMSFSDDGGKTWSPEQWGYMGGMGKFTYSQNPYWTDLGSFYERQFRFRVSHPVKTVLISANVDISVGI